MHVAYADEKGSECYDALGIAESTEGWAILSLKCYAVKTMSSDEDFGALKLWTEMDLCLKWIVCLDLGLANT